MRDPRRGFTLIEVVIVLMVGVILASIAMSTFGGAQDRLAVRQARATFASLHARARAQAIERGQMARLWVDTNADSVWIVLDGTQIETVRFRDELGVDIQGSMTQLRLCMSPRGFAETSCNSFSTTQTLTFAARGYTASADVRTLGQLSY